ncbi:Rv1733c family protein [Microbispora sp. CA-135349]|uniref:Rv1733c family protein n=1 Tax=Microbispora sp. CA-135349 TaxID=3239953 RepID=UPI003D8EB3C9
MRSIARWVVSRLRRYRPDRNPLRRRTDRVEAALAAAAVAAVLLAVWPAALAARTVYDGGLAAERVGPGARQLVEATLIQEVSVGSAGGRGMLGASLARWTLPGGEVREGVVPAALLLRNGQANARLWVDAAGSPAAPPPRRAETVTRAGLAAFGVMAAAAALAGACFVLTRHGLDRRRYREWDAAWAAADQRWRRHHI